MGVVIDPAAEMQPVFSGDEVCAMSKAIVAILVIEACGASGVSLEARKTYAVPDEVSARDAEILVRMGRAVSVDQPEAEDEAAKKAAEDEAAKKAAEDEAAKKAAEDEAAKKAAEDEAASGKQKK